MLNDLITSEELRQELIARAERRATGRLATVSTSEIIDTLLARLARRRPFDPVRLPHAIITSRGVIREEPPGFRLLELQIAYEIPVLPPDVEQ